MIDTLGFPPEEYKKVVIGDFVKQVFIQLEPVPLSDPPKFKLQVNN